MAYKITDACVKCGACADNCPVEAISEGDEMYVIDADTCVSCGALDASVSNLVCHDNSLHMFIYHHW